MSSIGQPLVVVFLWIPLMVSGLNQTTTKEDLKCGQLVDTEKLAFCCGMALLDKFLFVGSNCTPFWDNYGSCRYECLYRHWNLFDANSKVKKPELYTMITYLYNPLNGYHAYGTAFKEAHTACEEQGPKHDDFLKLQASAMTNGTGLDSKLCRPQAMLHAQCIMVHLTHNCPRANWRAVKECEDLRGLIKECLTDLVIEEVYGATNQELALLKESGEREKGGSSGNVLSGCFFLFYSLIFLIILDRI